ncbi:hypothetical protein EF847_22770 [Actinobacteria bacterium YIM 96077]|uniref:Alpha-galactosidase NEW3 domain-containing protein n=1 Tax=Phytoactinopolyspora halophila TaxID=1981511 RepID=A0A329QTU9_9ACTN|nr:DUF6049 family protein [Phytoactinopolyspora halophila]AYY15098.1 hypothetical protein EF847_22770 [Actinobacteria bacterium YIM 96077]RAW14722.1 hypothetical protein DPM12_10750 [Phytoactinopolyspora halophila]
MPGRTLLTTAAVVAVALIPVIPAHSSDGRDGAEVGAEATSYLHDVTPTVIAPGDELTLTGVVENTGDDPVTNVQALPRWSTVQLETRDEIRRVSRDPNLRHGIRYDDPFEVVTERLEPGERHEFELTIDVDEMGLGLAGVYAIGVDIRGSLANGTRITLDTTRTVVPWMPDEPSSSVDVALLWPVEAQPSLLPDGALRDEALAARIESDGPLDTVVDAASTAPVTWLVDPDVLDTVDAMADGYKTGSSPGSREDGEAEDRAQQWRSEFDDATSDSPVFLLPYAQPDVEALRRTDPGLASDLSSSAISATEDAGKSMQDVRTDVVRLETATTNETLEIFASGGAQTAILSGASVSPEGTHPLASVETSSGDLDTVITDPGLDAAIADAYAATNKDAGLLDLRQRWAAETAMAALDADVRAEQPAPLVVAPPERWRPDPAIASAVIDAWTSLPWITPTPVTELEQPTQPTAVTLDPVEAANELSGENVAAVADLRNVVNDYTDLMAETESSLARDLELATIRSASMGWRDDPAAGLEYASTIVDGLTEQVRDVRVTVPESVTLSSRTGVFPLTVTNDLDEAVTVKLDIEPSNPDRLKVGEVEEQHVEPGSRETVEIRAEAATNGRVPITVQLVTSDGSPLGAAEHTVVNATDYGTVGWFIIAGAGALFGAAIVRKVVRRRPGRPAVHQGSAGSGVVADISESRAERAPEVAR